MSILAKCHCCNTPLKVTNSAFKRSSTKNFYCNHVCRANVTNRGRVVSDAQKSKTSNTLRKVKPRKEHRCVACNAIFDPKRWGKKTCSRACFITRCKATGKLGGQAASVSPFTKRGRSRNEVAFYNKLLEIFPAAVHNRRMFGEYDADIILEEFKIAIHWNGPLHYRSIFGDDLLHNIQQRDILRYKAIESCGYENYIIDDSNNRGFSAQKVDLEVKLLLEFLKRST